MLRDKKIALFIDVDNLGLNIDHYESVLDQLGKMGEIVFGAVYGAGERKHRKIIEHAELNGFVVRRVARTKRRGRKNFDNRIVVDAVDAVLSNRAIDTVCILAQPTDMVYLYGYLRNKGMAIVAADNNHDEASRNFVNEFVDLGAIEVLKVAPKKKATAPKTATTETPAAPVQETAATEEPTIAEQADQTDALLREIERLRSTTAQFAPETTSAANEAVATEPAASETPVVTEQPTAEEAAPATTEETPAANAPRGQYNANNDSDLIDQLEGIRSGETDGESDDLIAQIKKLLDGVE